MTSNTMINSKNRPAVRAPKEADDDQQHDDKQQKSSRGTRPERGR